MRIHIGTSGFYYEHWRGILYPDKLPKNRWFERYASLFGTLELNSTFYHLPRSLTVRHWLERAPKGFLFSFKAPRVITHDKRLRGVREDLLRFLHLLKPLKEKTGAILFQLPPSLHGKEEVLGEFLALLPHGGGWRFAMEFRHESWYAEEIFAMLRHYNVAVCRHDYGGGTEVTEPTAGFEYFRLHGTSGHYRGSYGEEELRALAGKIRDAAAHHREVFVYFNNDLDGAAVTDAQRLGSLLEIEWPKGRGDED